MTPPVSSRPWYEEAFRADYRRVYPHRDLEDARRDVRFLLAHALHGRVLDLCCGFGRHVLFLREAGVDALGLDLSPELLGLARELPGWERYLSGRLVRAEMTHVPFAAGAFDGVVVLFSSFGYLGERGDALALAELARVLRADGLAVLDLMNPARVRAELVPTSRRAGDGFEIAEARSLEDGGRRVVKQVELRFSTGEVRRWREEVRLYEADELDALLGGTGLRVEHTFGDFDGRPADPRAPRRLVLARRITGKS